MTILIHPFSVYKVDSMIGTRVRRITKLPIRCENSRAIDGTPTGLILQRSGATAGKEREFA